MNPEHEPVIDAFHTFGYDEVEILASHGEHHLIRTEDEYDVDFHVSFYDHQFEEGGGWQGYLCNCLVNDPSSDTLAHYNPESLRYLLNLYKLLLP